MYNILLIDDKSSNNVTLELLIESYLEENGIELQSVNIVSLDNGIDAIKKVLLDNNIDIIFLDLMMPKIQGMDVLEVIRLADLKKQPKIIIVTALHDKDTRLEAKRKKANAYITKPIDIKMIKAMLDYYLKSNFVLVSSNLNSFDNFEDNLEDDFFDLDGFEDIISEGQRRDINTYNQSHLKVKAEDFLKDIDNLEHIIEDFQDIEYDLIKTIDNLDEKTLSKNIEIILESFNTYASVLNGFHDFYELSVALRQIKRVLSEANFSDEMPLKNKQKIANYTKAILNDLVEWQNHVFVSQDALDVFYINASLLSSCMQLENMIKNAYNL